MLARSNVSYTHSITVCAMAKKNESEATTDYVFHLPLETEGKFKLCLCGLV